MFYTHTFTLTLNNQTTRNTREKQSHHTQHKLPEVNQEHPIIAKRRNLSDQSESHPILPVIGRCRFDSCSGLVILFVQSFALSKAYLSWLHSKFICAHMMSWLSEMMIGRRNSFRVLSLFSNYENVLYSPLKNENLC
jgi:hypothetical protein